MEFTFNINTINDLLKLLISLCINVFALSAVMLLWKKSNSVRNDFSFTLALINLVTFLMCFLLQKTTIEMGFALGLFAVFGILRYRTETVSTKSMTYLFICIGLAIINSLSDIYENTLELLVSNILLLIFVFIIEKIKKKVSSYNILLDETTIVSLNEAEQKKWLSEKLKGKQVESLSIIEVDYLRDTIMVNVSIID